MGTNLYIYIYIYIYICVCVCVYVYSAAAVSGLGFCSVYTGRSFHMVKAVGPRNNSPLLPRLGMHGALPSISLIPLCRGA